MTSPSEPAAGPVLSPTFLKLQAGLLFFMLNMSAFNLLPYYLELRGASPDLYGQVAGAMGVSNLAGVLLLGHRADAWSRKATMNFYFVASFAANVLAIWAMSQPSLLWYYPVRLLQGVFMGLGFPILSSWVMETAPPGRKQVALAWLGIGGIMANSLGPTLGELVLNLQPDPDAPSAYLGVFVMATAFQLLGLLAWNLAPDSRPEPRGEGQRTSLLPLLRRPESGLLLLVGLCFGGVFGSLMSFGKNYTAALDLEFVSLLLWAYTVGAILSRLFYQLLQRFISNVAMIQTGLAGLAVTFVVLALAGGYPLLVTGGLIYGLSHGLLFPTLFSRFVDAQHASELGRASTLFQGTFAIGWGLFPLVGGTLVRLSSFPAYFAGLAAIAAACIGLHLQAERAMARGRAGA